MKMAESVFSNQYVGELLKQRDALQEQVVIALDAFKQSSTHSYYCDGSASRPEQCDACDAVKRMNAIACVVYGNTKGV
jgi:hypothetical protein